jgi:hypothetical protein
MGWKESFDDYKVEENAAYAELLRDEDWQKLHSELNPGIDVRLSLIKAHVNFWSTEEAWHHKKRSKAKSINWKSTFGNALSMKGNRVWKPREEAFNSPASTYGDFNE